MSSSKKSFGLVFNPEKCNGCLECEKACITSKKSTVAAGKSRIKISKEGEKHKAVMCVHCERCEPADLCPSALLEFHEEGKYWTLDEHRCFACMACMPRCTYEGIFFEGEFGVETAYMCDLCGGEPKCLKACSEGALTLSQARGNEG
ncbi:TPA: 4Fe-4S binding protein [Thermoplasmata archaeon]|nr:4Fe-4S binding protein [Thermoplasmata archaeon]